MCREGCLCYVCDLGLFRHIIPVLITQLIDLGIAVNHLGADWRGIPQKFEAKSVEAFHQRSHGFSTSTGIIYLS